MCKQKPQTNDAIFVDLERLKSIEFLFEASKEITVSRFKYEQHNKGVFADVKEFFLDFETNPNITCIAILKFR